MFLAGIIFPRSQDYFCTITCYGYSSSFQSLFATGAHLFNFQLPINGDGWFSGMMLGGYEKLLHTLCLKNISESGSRTKRFILRFCSMEAYPLTANQNKGNLSLTSEKCLVT